MDAAEGHRQNIRRHGGGVGVGAGGGHGAEKPVDVPIVHGNAGSSQR